MNLGRTFEGISGNIIIEIYGKFLGGITEKLPNRGNLRKIFSWEYIKVLLEKFLRRILTELLKNSG